jgi:hypothetical protein
MVEAAHAETMRERSCERSDGVIGSYAFPPAH